MNNGICSVAGMRYAFSPAVKFNQFSNAMKLIRYSNPSSYFSDFDSFFSEPFRAFEPFFRNVATSPYRGQAAGINWYENEESFVVRIDLPGVKRENLEIEAEKGLLHLSWTYQQETENENQVQKNRAEHVLRCPEGVNVAQVAAKLEDGVLTLTLPKAEEKKPVRIEIK